MIAFHDLLGLPDHKMRETQAHGGPTASACPCLFFCVCEIGLPVFPFFRGAWPCLQPLSPQQWVVLGWTPECESQAVQRGSLHIETQHWEERGSRVSCGPSQG